MGGRGADIFVLETQSGADTIKDFSIHQDEIQLQLPTRDASLSKGLLSAAVFRLGNHAIRSSDRVIYNSFTGALLFDPDGSGGQSSRLIATLDNSPNLRHFDIRII